MKKIKSGLRKKLTVRLLGVFFVCGMFLAATTAANVLVSSKVMAATGESLANAEVVLTDSLGNSRRVRTSSFGFYRFTEIASGQLYVFEVRKKRCQFNPQIITINEEISELNFTAEP